MPTIYPYHILLAVSFLVFAHAMCRAQPFHTHPVEIPKIDFNPKTYVCYYADGKITIDGKLDEAAWAKAEWTDFFVDIEGPLRPSPRFRTRAKMLWDENYFYIAAELEEPDIWATLTERDDIIFYDNDFEVFIDPDGDTHRYVELEINAFNTIWDLLLIQPYRDMRKAALHDWDIKGINTGVAIYGTLNQPGDRDSSWTVEIAFPWTAFREITDLHLPPRDGDQWRINFSRVQWRTEVVDGAYKKVINPETNESFPEDNWVWSPQGVVNMHYPEMWGYVQFTTDPVGNSKVPFVTRKEEEAKWFLRQVYYRQRNYYAEHGTFTDSMDDLKLAGESLPGFQMPPSLEATTNTFEAYLRSEDGSVKVRIRQDGLVWEERM